MRRSIASIGLALLLLAPAGAAAQTNLYDLMRTITDQELLQSKEGAIKVEKPVRDFVAAIFRNQGVTSQDVELAVSNSPRFCSNRKQDIFACVQLREPIRELAERESRIRALGRDLQIIATGSEAPAQDFATDQLNLPLRSQGILRIWRAGTDNTAIRSSGALVRTVELLPTLTPDQEQNLTPDQQFDREALRDALQAFADHLAELRTGTDDLEQFHGAVWRYQHGLRHVQGRAGPDYLPLQSGSLLSVPEWQFLGARWDQLEEDMEYIKILMPDPNALTPPLKEGEVVMFYLSEDARAIFDAMNVAPWMTYEKSDPDFFIADIGLKWRTAVQPVLPSLCREQIGQVRSGDECDPILGGTTVIAQSLTAATRAAGDGTITSTGAGVFLSASASGTIIPELLRPSGLCLGPLSRSGYLCRAMSQGKGREACEELTVPDPNKVVLTRCQADGEVRETLSGPDVCSQYNWQVTPQRASCQPQIDCSRSVNFADPRFPVRKVDGAIQIPLGQGSELPPPYEGVKLLEHAFQICPLPEGTDLFDQPDPAMQNASCCRQSRDAYTAACEAMAADGLFGTGATVERFNVLGRPLNARTCADILADSACRARGYGVCQDTFTRTDTDQTVSQMRLVLLQQVRTQWQQRNQPVADVNPGYGSCTWIKDGVTDDEQGDTRIEAWVRTVEQIGTEACIPGQTIEYQNTIGNNLCMLGTCVEESFERHRIAPGRQPFAVGDQAYPYDACIPLPKDGGTLTAIPPELSTAIPPYRPGLLAQTLDTALCQTIGLPSASPPARCAFNPARRLSLPLPSPVQNALDILDQDRESSAPAEGLSLMAEAVASRIGTELYRGYLEDSANNLSRITDAASRLLDRFSTVEFPSAMCPRNDPDGSVFLNTPYCAAP